LKNLNIISTTDAIAKAVKMSKIIFKVLPADSAD